MDGASPLFQLDGISFRHPGKPVVADLSLRLDAGRFYGLLGPNGCGKTTLIDLLAGMKTPEAGCIWYKGKALSGLTRKALAKEIALVPQDFYINFPFTAREVVLMGRYPYMRRFSPPSLEDVQVVEAILAATAAEGVADRRVTDLSGGEKQRVVFARALAQDTPVLMLDEATSNLDIRHAIHLLNVTAELVDRRGRTVLAVFQDINLAAMFCDHLLLMQDGRIVDRGPTAEVLTVDALKAVFGVDSAVRFDPVCGAVQVSFRRG
jgi:iron complex transport system ATP-binding protein